MVISGIKYHFPFSTWEYPIALMRNVDRKNEGMVKLVTEHLAIVGEFDIPRGRNIKWKWHFVEHMTRIGSWIIKQ